jgi:hypothetical protein
MLGKPSAVRDVWGAGFSFDDLRLGLPRPKLTGTTGGLHDGVGGQCGDRLGYPSGWPGADDPKVSWRRQRRQEPGRVGSAEAPATTT